MLSEHDLDAIRTFKNYFEGSLPIDYVVRYSMRRTEIAEMPPQAEVLVVEVTFNGRETEQLFPVLELAQSALIEEHAERSSRACQATLEQLGSSP